MPAPVRSPRRFGLTRQAVVFQIALLTVVVLIGLVTSAVVLRRDLTQEYEQRALAVARSVAQQPDLARQVLAGHPTPGGPVQARAQRVRAATHALYVVVTDDRGIRFSHPNPALIGRRVSTSPEEALSGHEVAAVERGTLGLSARGKVPLRAADGSVVGEVSVGIDIDEVNARTRRLVLLLAAVTAVPFGIGVLGAVALARRLRRTILGLEPQEMADLLREHAAVLGGVRDGIIAVDSRGVVTVTNPEAVRLVGHPLRHGVPLAQSGAPSAVVDLLRRAPAPSGELSVLGERLVLATRLPVRREGRDLGKVLVLRDRTHLDELAREVEATRGLTDALRAQAHEHTNRLHALTGMLSLGHVDEAREYLSELATATTWVEGVEDPYLAGLLAAKSAVASEAGVRLVCTDATWVEGRLAYPLDTITVVANLVDNAIRAASQGPGRPAWVEVTLLSAGGDLTVHVVDSGPGVPAAHVDRLFDYGFTTRGEEHDEHGIGLVLARQTARNHRGEVALVDAGGKGHGAAFEATMAGAVVATAATAGRADQ